MYMYICGTISVTNINFRVSYHRTTFDHPDNTNKHITLS